MNDKELHAQRKRDVHEQNIRFQPVVLVLHDQKPNRAECLCGAMATFINIELNEDGRIYGWCVKCHDCYCSEETQNEQ
jgi:hypothetical protein